MKYIEENRLGGAGPKEPHRNLIKSAGTVASNLLFQDVLRAFDNRIESVGAIALLDGEVG